MITSKKPMKLRTQLLFFLCFLCLYFVFERGWIIAYAEQGLEMIEKQVETKVKKKNYLIKDLDHLNEIRELETDIERLKRQVVEAEKFLDFYEKEHPPEKIERVAPAAKPQSTD